MPNVARPATGKLFHVENQTIHTQGTALANKLADPTKEMSIGAEVIAGLRASVQSMQNMKGIADSELPEVRGGLTGSKYGQWTGMTGTVATALLSFAALGFSIYDLVKVIQKEKKEAPEIAQVVVQVATCAGVIIQGAIWKAHSWYAKREAQLRAMSNEAIENASAIAIWSERCHLLDLCVTQTPLYAAGQGVRMLDLDSAWDKLPVDQQELNSLTRIKEQHLLKLPEENDLRDIFNKMRAASVTCIDLRNKFFQSHPQLNAQNINLQTAYHTIKADIKKTKKNHENVDEYKQGLSKFKRAHTDLAVNWLILEAHIGRFDDFDVQLDGYRCRKPGILFQPNHQIPPPLIVANPPLVAPQNDKLIIGGSSFFEDDLIGDSEPQLVHRKQPSNSSGRNLGEGFVEIEMDQFGGGHGIDTSQFVDGDGDLKKDD